MHIRILIVEDHKVKKDCLRSLLEKCAEFEVVAETGSEERALTLFGQLKPDVVITDMAMRSRNGSHATRRILEGAPDAKVIACMTHSERRSIGEMLETGANGYLLKERVFEELGAAVREVAAGNTFLGEYITEAPTGNNGPQEPVAGTQVPQVLTSREREVLRLIADGLSTAQIAAGLKISSKTVDTHRQHIREKLNIRGIAELTRYAIREGITPL